MITELNERSRVIFRYIVDTYLADGSPIGSRTISRHAGINLSPASIRNTMADLEDAGLLYAPHTSAGRIPTEQGIRLYIDGLMQVGAVEARDRRSIEEVCLAQGRSVDDVLESTGHVLAGLSSCASLVIAPKMSGSIKQIQFVQIGVRKILTILVFDNGLVENRILDVEEDVPPASLMAANNYLNAKLAGRSIDEAGAHIAEDILKSQTQLDAITERLVQAGLALPSAEQQASGRIIIRGQSKLLEDVKALEDLEKARELLGYLEKKQNMLGMLNAVGDADGVQIFIGAQNDIFDQSGWSMIISPYRDGAQKIVGAIGVIGPTRLDYDRIIPMVDYTSRVVSKLVER